MLLPRCVKLSLGSPAVMALPPGFLLQSSSSLALPFGSGLLLGRRTEELGSASGSAFAPYSASAAPVLPFGGEPRAATSTFVSPVYNPSQGISGSLDYHPFGPLGPYPYGDSSYRKNATRDATATLKAWLSEHRKNPYPTKGEKIMLAIITKMTLTQVSTWFANARRRLKKENKMTWTPRNRSEDEEEEDAIDLERHEEDEESVKLHDDELEPRSKRDSCRLMFREDTSPNQGLTDLESGDQSHIQGPISVSESPPQNRPLEALRVSRSEHMLSPSEEQVDSCCATLGPNPKPKLWSLAEIATSADKRSSDSSQSGGRSSVSNDPTLPRPLYYTSPFMAGYSSFSPLGSLHGALHGDSHLNGIQQKVLQWSEVATQDCRLRSMNHIELHQLKTGMTNV